MTDSIQTTSHLYYAEFAGEVFVIQAEHEAVDNSQTTLAVLRGVRDLLQHGIRVVLVFGKGAAFEARLAESCGVRPHPETNRLIIPESALPRIQQQRLRIAESLQRVCRDEEIPCEVLPSSTIGAERRIAHESTGIVTRIDTAAVEAVVAAGRLAMLGFGGEDGHGRFLHVPSVSLAADLAVALKARKLLLLTRDEGIAVPGRRGGRQTLSFADFEQLLCLLQRKGPDGQSLLSGAILPKVHASIRAVAGGVRQIHIVSYDHLLDEILTHTGVGTMIERHQSHQVDYARPEDLPAVEALHAQSQRYATSHGTPYVKPRDRAALERLLPQTLLLKHRQVVVGKMHATEIPSAAGTVLIGGLVVGENHQDSQQGQLLLAEALARFREQGYRAAAAVTASDRAKRLFQLHGGISSASRPWQIELLERSRPRYHPDERDQVELFVFTL